MKTGKLILVLSMLSLGLNLVACSYEHVKGGDHNFNLGKADDCGPVDFATINAMVFKKSCTGCHNPNSGEEVDGIYFDQGFMQVKSQLDKSVQAVLSGKMPKFGRPNEDQVQLLLAWQKQGAPEFTAEPSVQSCKEKSLGPVDPVKPVDPVDPVDPIDPDVLEANYNSIRKHILEVKCSGCHGINDTHPKPAKHQFDTYAEIIQYKDLFNPLSDESDFAQALISGDMPFMEDPLPENEIAVIVDWIKAGLPETKGGPPAILPIEVLDATAN